MRNCLRCRQKLIKSKIPSCYGKLRLICHEKYPQSKPDPLADQPGEPRGYRRVMHKTNMENLQDFVNGIKEERAWPEVKPGEPMPPEYYEVMKRNAGQPSLSERLHAAREEEKARQAALRQQIEKGNQAA